MNDILNFQRISETLATAGQPSAEQFSAIRAARFEVVVNLATDTSENRVPNEAELVAGLGMEYVHIPVVWTNPTADDLDRFFEKMYRCQGRNVFVHCALNMRVSAFVFLYRAIRQQVPLETARAPMLRIWQPDGRWAEFIVAALARHGLATPGA